MTVTAASFKARFTEFAAVADARVELFLADAVLVLNEVYWDLKYDLGINYYTAHLLYLADQAADGSGEGTSGAITGRSVDGTSVSYGSGNPTSAEDAWLLTTTYGSRYLSLRKSLGVPAASI
ncbi:MAG: DUF4054 domain-containing protein [bacterium]|nr:DUF4054 domain-containing protein [bacterium]